MAFVDISDAIRAAHFFKLVATCGTTADGFIVFFNAHTAVSAVMCRAQASACEEKCTIVIVSCRQLTAKSLMFDLIANLAQTRLSTQLAFAVVGALCRGFVFRTCK